MSLDTYKTTTIANPKIAGIRFQWWWWWRIITVTTQCYKAKTCWASQLANCTYTSGFQLKHQENNTSITKVTKLINNHILLKLLDYYIKPWYFYPKHIKKIIPQKPEIAIRKGQNSKYYPEESKLLATEREHLLTIGDFRNENCTLYCLYSMGNTSQSEKGDKDEDPHKTIFLFVGSHPLHTTYIRKGLHMLGQRYNPATSSHHFHTNLWHWSWLFILQKLKLFAPPFQFHQLI